ncbi:MAG: hypothetical protein AAGM46_15290 [Cyanobacteria bacterium J06582_2]
MDLRAFSLVCDASNLAEHKERSQTDLPTHRIFRLSIERLPQSEVWF